MYLRRLSRAGFLSIEEGVALAFLSAWRTLSIQYGVYLLAYMRASRPHRLKQLCNYAPSPQQPLESGRIYPVRCGRLHRHHLYAPRLLQPRADQIDYRLVHRLPPASQAGGYKGKSTITGAETTFAALAEIAETLCPGIQKD